MLRFPLVPHAVVELFELAVFDTALTSFSWSVQQV
jgi:hypothetical protein